MRQVPTPHLSQKLQAFVQWHDQYFAGIRQFPQSSTCGPVELVQVRDRRMALPWYERMLRENELGDVYGRVNRGNILKALRHLVLCCRETGKLEEATKWQERISQIGN